MHFSYIYLHSVEEADVELLFAGRELLGKEITRIKLNFKVYGQDEGKYAAVIAAYEDGEFYLDAVYRETEVKNTTRLNIALPGW